MRYYFSSMTRITDLAERPFEVRCLPHERWSRGDYVVGEVTATAGFRYVELVSGRMIELGEGDLLVGAFGRRFATLEATGSWTDIEHDGRMHLMTGGGLLGRCVSRSALVPPLISLAYRGHVLVDEAKARMQDYVEAVPEQPFTLPVVLVVGTSMSAGKTTAGRIVVRQLKQAGLTVLGAKLTGAGRYRDVLSMYDAGADYIFDFVDVGLPSTVVPEADYRRALGQLLSRMSAVEADVAVIEVGASPLEPYNGTTAIAMLEEHVRFTILCASDPYAVVGVITAYDRRPDLVTGIATNTEAGVQLVEKLTDLRALNIRDKGTLPELRTRLFAALGLPERPTPSSLTATPG